MEEWRDIDGFPGYEVNKNGDVRSFVNNRHGVINSPHMLKPMLNHRGYETVCLGRGNRKLVHRLVADAFIPNPDDLPLVRHLDDNPRNNNVDNLAWGTQTDNMQDCVRHGRLVGDTRAAIESRKIGVIATPINSDRSIRFESLSEAARALNVWPQHISSVAKGRLRQTGGYTFEFVEEDNDERYY